MKQRPWWVVLLALFAVFAGCSDDTPKDDETVTQSGDLRPMYTPGQTWTVAVSYRAQGVKSEELMLTLNAEVADPTSVDEVFRFVPPSLAPPEGEVWTEPVYWTYGVINTAYVPDAESDFYPYAVAPDGSLSEITIIKVVADKDLNTTRIAETLDPVFYLVLRESDMRVRGIHYNYKVRDSRNTVVVEMPENDSEKPAPAADQAFFLVPYLMPAFPLDGAAEAPYTVELAEGTQDVSPEGTGVVSVAFDTSFDGSRVAQQWSDGAPWFDTSVHGDQRAWRLTPEQVTELRGSSISTSVEFLEPAEAIATKFRNPIRLSAVYTVEEGEFSASVPPSHIPWSGYFWNLKNGAAIFGWDELSGTRREGTKGPATTLKASIRDEMSAIDTLLADIRDKERGSDEWNTMVEDYRGKKRAANDKIGTHFESLGDKIKSGEIELTQEAIQSWGPLEKYDLYMVANKLGGSRYDAWGATQWELENQWNPGGPGWWGHCNGWAAAAILTEQPTEPISVSIPTEPLTGEQGELTLTFEPGDLKAISSLSYYSSRSHFYGQRYNGEEQNVDDLEPHIFHRIITYYIGQEKFPLVFDTTATEEVWNFPAYAYDMTIVEQTDFEGLDGRQDVTRAFDVVIDVKLGTDGVDEDYVAEDLTTQEHITETWTYTLYTDDNGRAKHGVWTGDSAGDAASDPKHPDFAWVTYANNDTFAWRSNENPQLVVRHVNELITLRENAPRVCDAAANDGAGDCPGGLLCNTTNGLCEEGQAPQTGSDCAGGAQRSEAATLAAGDTPGLSVCSGRDSFFSLDLVKGQQAQIRVDFTHAEGDIDIQLLDAAGTVLASSESVANSEAVAHTATVDGAHILRIYGYNGAENTVSVSVTFDDAPAGCQEEDAALANNDDRASAPALDAARSFPGGICGADSDWYSVTLTGAWTARVEFAHAVGDLDLALVDADGNVVNTSQSTSDSEEVQATGPHFIRVYGYSGATGAYTLTLSE